MKVVIIGAGGQGTGLADLLVRERDVDDIVLADHDVRALDQAHGTLSSAGADIGRIACRRVDAADVDDVARLISGADVAVNAILPKFNIPIMKACVREAVHYTDLLALPDASGTPKEETYSAQLELDDAFRQAGALAIPYVGLAGGWSSLVVKRAIDGMETVDEVLFYCCAHIDTDEFIAPVAPIVQMSMFFGPPGPLANLGGVLTTVDLLASAEDYEFPGPAGKRRVYTMNVLGDIAMIPDFAGKSIRRLESKMALGLGRLDTAEIWIKALARACEKQGHARTETSIVEAMAEAFVLPTEYPRLLREGKIRDDHFTVVIEVRGTMDGRPCTSRNWSITTLESTRRHLPWAWPAVYSSIGNTPVEYVLAMGRGRIPQRGVRRVTDLDNAAEILEGVARRGHVLGEEVLRDVPQGCESR
ncbi:MAG: saccharopine dehydrogenase NADP-binding domain-containing protein [Burkholderiales bacterium]|nr:saccharopine dehydrogenase NADP-binding domain-containing protein [Burkholderiales bacterium]